MTLDIFYVALYAQFRKLRNFSVLGQLMGNRQVPMMYNRQVPMMCNR